MPSAIGYGSIELAPHPYTLIGLRSKDFLTARIIEIPMSILSPGDSFHPFVAINSRNASPICLRSGIVIKLVDPALVASAYTIF